jgi:hypothetical protein
MRIFFFIFLFSFQLFASDCRDLLRDSANEVHIQEQREIADRKVIGFIIEEKRLPVGKEWDELLGFIQAKYFGTGSYREGFSGSRAKIYQSPYQAYESLLVKFENSDLVKKHLSEEERVELVENLKEKFAYNRLQYSPIYFDSDLEFLQNKAHDLVIRFIVLNKRLPRGIEWNEVLGNPSKYFGYGRYEKTGSSREARLHDSPRHAYGRLLQRLLSFERPDLLSFEDHLKVLSEIEEKMKRRL